MTSPGPRNLITDVTGLRVGNAEDHRIKTGVTVLVGDKPFVASVDAMGGAPGARETELLAPDKLVQEIDAIVLAGGSAFGLEAASGVADSMRRQGRGFRVETAVVPIVPAAIIFDLLSGGDKDWATNPYPALGVQALAAADSDFAIGTAGAGVGAMTATLKGGLGSASLVVRGFTIGALVVANPTGSVTVGDSAHFWAAPFEIDNEFGGRGPYKGAVPFEQSARSKRDWVDNPIANTTIAIVATDAALSKAQCKRLAVAAQDGIARGASPSHTQVDGDMVFALSTGAKPLDNHVLDILQIGHAAAVCLSRAMARAVYSATPAPADRLQTWQEKFGR
jgi:D-aminopeptidase